MLVTLQELMTSGTREVEDAAARVSKYKTLLNANQITNEEFTSLSEQLLDLDKINKLATTDEHKRLLEEGFKALRLICSLL